MRGVVLACLLSAAGCTPATFALYTPRPLSSARGRSVHTERLGASTARLTGYPARRYELPPRDPRGSVVVASFGEVWVDPRGAPPLFAVHARLLVENAEDAEPWQVDARDLRLVFPGGPQVSPALVNATVTGVPTLAVPPGRELALDAYFPVPPDRIGAPIPSYLLVWTVITPRATFTKRTPFVRLVEPAGAVPRVDEGLGASPYWWFGPRFFRPRVFGVRPPRVFVATPSGQ